METLIRDLYCILKDLSKVTTAVNKIRSFLLKSINGKVPGIAL